jgi:cbb3-type cytochrome oxidase maturation protein
VNAMFLLVSASLLVAIGFLIAFLWAVKSGQFEDKYTPKIRMLFDEHKKVTDQDQEQRNSKEN